MSLKMNLNKDWMILQDVHDAGEGLEIYKDDFNFTSIATQISEWEHLDELKHLQLVFAKQPYFGRELRYFNQAPWWYKKTVTIPKADHYVLSFTNVDYYCKVWVNGQFAGSHEGYSAPFELQINDMVKEGEENTIIVKVWSPWDEDVEGGYEELRTIFVLRNMVKGSYEHSDTFVQRDVNPVGIYGDVTLNLIDDVWFEQKPEISYDIDYKHKAVEVKTCASLCFINDSSRYSLKLNVIDQSTNECIAKAEKPITQNGETTVSVSVDNIRLWNTWDQGHPWLYRIILKIEYDGRTVCEYSETTGFRTTELLRDKNQTCFVINGKRQYMRGTSYFPDVYISAMSEDRYKRDLLAIKACGFNLVRVHVHVEQQCFYRLCDEIGLAVMQDSEFNWRHTPGDVFAKRFISVFVENIHALKYHPSIICWICMNEPGQLENIITEGINESGLLESIPLDGNPESAVMTEYLGPELYEATIKADPTRPVIKGSYCTNDLLSGDSHNYTGSLFGDGGHYSDIYGTAEKFNTEFGVDAPPKGENLKKVPAIYHRLKNISDKIDDIQYYQYALIKYYIEHYRMQKYGPCSGYVQFLFNDVGPQSFYGLYDWWGLPKRGLDAVFESNMPIGMFLKYNKKLDAIYVINDYPYEIGECRALWIITDGERHVILKQQKDIFIGSDTAEKVTDLNVEILPNIQINVALTLQKGDKVIAKNNYRDVLNMPSHIKGHPSRMNHEIGMRLYWA